MNIIKIDTTTLLKNYSNYTLNNNDKHRVKDYIELIKDHNINFKFPSPQRRKITLRDILDKNPEKKKIFQEVFQKVGRQNKNSWQKWLISYFWEHFQVSEHQIPIWLDLIFRFSVGLMDTNHNALDTRTQTNMNLI